MPLMMAVHLNGHLFQGSSSTCTHCGAAAAGVDMEPCTGPKPAARVWTKPGPMTVRCGTCGAEGVAQERDGERFYSWPPAINWEAIARELYREFAAYSAEDPNGADVTPIEHFVARYGGHR